MGFSTSRLWFQHRLSEEHVKWQCWHSFPTFAQRHCDSSASISSCITVVNTTAILSLSGCNHHTALQSSVTITSSAKNTSMEETSTTSLWPNMVTTDPGRWDCLLMVCTRPKQWIYSSPVSPGYNWFFNETYIDFIEQARGWTFTHTQIVHQFYWS